MLNSNIQLKDEPKIAINSCYKCQNTADWSAHYDDFNTNNADNIFILREENLKQEKKQLDFLFVMTPVILLIALWIIKIQIWITNYAKQIPQEVLIECTILIFITVFTTFSLLTSNTVDDTPPQQILSDIDDSSLALVTSRDYIDG